MSASSGPPTHQKPMCKICMLCYKPKGAKTVTPQSRAKLKSPGHVAQLAYHTTHEVLSSSPRWGISHDAKPSQALGCHQRPPEPEGTNNSSLGPPMCSTSTSTMQPVGGREGGGWGDGVRESAA